MKHVTKAIKNCPQESTPLDLGVIEQRVCDIVSEQVGLPRNKVLPTSRLIEDLGCDSLEVLELLMELEDEFCVTIPDDPENPVGKSVFTRKSICMSDLAELVYLQHGTGQPDRKGWRRKTLSNIESSPIPFSQLSGRWQAQANGQTQSLFEPLGTR